MSLYEDFEVLIHQLSLCNELKINSHFDLTVCGMHTKLITRSGTSKIAVEFEVKDINRPILLSLIKDCLEIQGKVLKV